MSEGGAIAYITSTGGYNWDREGNREFYMPLIEAKGWENKIAALEALNLNALPGPVCYMLAKSAMNYYVAKAQGEFAEKGIRVNALMREAQIPP